MSTCLDESTILDFVAGTLPTEKLPIVQAHLGVCDECRVLVSHLASSGTQMLPPSKGPIAFDKTAPSIPPPKGAPPVSPGQILAGKYEVERVLGSGGMGIVIAAKHLQLGQRVALKFLSPTACTSKGAIGRFLREARSAARLEGEHVVRVLDVGELDGGAPYLVMELLRGKDLGSVIRERGPLPIKEAIDYTLQACEAVAEAHVRGVVHRDLKPANLFLTERPDGSPLVKVLDFGIAKASADDLDVDVPVTDTDAMMGSPKYMSPEQIQSPRSVDARTDVWSMGVVLWELVTAQPIWPAASLADLCSAIVSSPLPALRALRPDAPAVLEDAIATCLQKDREQRFTSVAALAEALAPIAPQRSQVTIERTRRLVRRSSAPSAAQPPLSMKTLGAEERRNRAPLLIAVALGVFALGTGVGIAAMMWRGSSHATISAPASQPIATKVEPLQPLAFDRPQQEMTAPVPTPKKPAPAISTAPPPPKPSNDAFRDRK